MSGINRKRTSARNFRCAIIGASSLLLSWGVLILPTRANSIVSLEPLPSSPSVPAFTFNGSPVPGFGAGTGSVGNGDGGLPLNAQTPGGLELQTPFSIVVAPGYGEQNNVDGSTTFYDTTLALTGLSASGFAQTAFGLDIQPLTNGTFAIYESQAGGGDGPLLLSGTLTNNEIAGVDGSDSAAVFSSTVTYTGGPIYNALVADGGSVTDNASFNLSLTGLSNLGINGGSGYLNSFNADGQALFNATGYTIPTPEPSSIALFALGLLGLGVVAVRRKRSLA